MMGVKMIRPFPPLLTIFCFGKCRMNLFLVSESRDPKRQHKQRRGLSRLGAKKNPRMAIQIKDNGRRKEACSSEKMSQASISKILAIHL